MANTELQFQYTCVGLTGKRLAELETIVDNSTEITYNTFRNNVDKTYIKDMNNYYGIPLSKDWAVSFHKSHFTENNKKTTVYYMIHSGIEHVFY